MVAQDSLSVPFLWNKVGGKGFVVFRPTNDFANLTKYRVVSVGLSNVEIVQGRASYISMKEKNRSDLFHILDIKFKPNQLSIHVEEYLSRLYHPVKSFPILETMA